MLLLCTDTHDGSEELVHDVHKASWFFGPDSKAERYGDVVEPFRSASGGCCFMRPVFVRILLVCRVRLSCTIDQFLVSTCSLLNELSKQS